MGTTREKLNDVIKADIKLLLRTKRNKQANMFAELNETYTLDYFDFTYLYSVAVRELANEPIQ